MSHPNRCWRSVVVGCYHIYYWLSRLTFQSQYYLVFILYFTSQRDYIIFVIWFWQSINNSHSSLSSCQLTDTRVLKLLVSSQYIESNPYNLTKDKLTEAVQHRYCKSYHNCSGQYGCHPYYWQTEKFFGLSTMIDINSYCANSDVGDDSMIPPPNWPRPFSW